LTMPTNAMSVSGYDWVINYEFMKEEVTEFEGKNGQYEVYWNQMRNGGISKFTLTLNEELIIEKDMNDYMDFIADKYPPGENIDKQPSIEDMTYIIETNQVEVMLEFREIEISVDPREDRINYWLGLDSIYIREK